MLTHYLMTLQDRLHLSDSAFADALGLDPETWQLLRDGAAIYTPAILARLLLHVPNAHPLALEELHLQQERWALRLLDGTIALPAMPAQPAVEGSDPAPAALAEEAPPLAYVA